MLDWLGPDYITKEELLLKGDALYPIIPIIDFFENKVWLDFRLVYRIIAKSSLSLLSKYSYNLREIATKTQRHEY